MPPVVGLSAGKDAGIEGVQGNHRFLPLWFVSYSGYLGFPAVCCPSSTSKVDGSEGLFWAMIRWFADGVLLGPLVLLNLGSLFLEVAGLLVPGLRGLFGKRIPFV